MFTFIFIHVRLTRATKFTRAKRNRNNDTKSFTESFSLFPTLISVHIASINQVYCLFFDRMYCFFIFVERMFCWPIELANVRASLNTSWETLGKDEYFL